MRIFIGTIEIAGQIPQFALGFRALGHEVTTGTQLGHSYKFDSSLTYDVQVDLANPSQAASIIANHDVFLFLPWQAEHAEYARDARRPSRDHTAGGHSAPRACAQWHDTGGELAKARLVGVGASGLHMGQSRRVDARLVRSAAQ